jgi:hypothetical protein
MTPREEQEAVCSAISKVPGRYQTRSSADDPGTIQVKGGHMKGWERLTLAEARERFRLKLPSPEPAAKKVDETPGKTMRARGRDISGGV